LEKINKSGQYVFCAVLTAYYSNGLSTTKTGTNIVDANNERLLSLLC